jgi:hypothetical protein
MKTSYNIHIKTLMGVVAAWGLVQSSSQALPTVMSSAVDPGNGNLYYLLTPSNWTDAENEAVLLGGTLATVQNEAEDTWIWNQWGSVADLWIGLYDPTTGDGSGAQHAADFIWASGSTSTFRNWRPGEPSNTGGAEYWTYIHKTSLGVGDTWNDVANEEAIPGEGNAQGVVEVVPEPSTIGLVGCAGAIALAARRSAKAGFAK